MLKNITSYFSSKSDIRIGQVEKFVEFNKQIDLVKEKFDLNPNKKLVVISFLGKARIGKSTLMNCFVSNLAGTNGKHFNTSSSVKSHCTNGIDILPIETEEFNIVLLDVQGLDFKDSKNDCKLMLFVFMLSNLIVYNEKGILTNSVLASFQSLTSLLTYMHDDHVKPNLIFRSIDIDDELDDYDPNENLTDMLNSDLADQYLNVRKSLTRLFDKIACIPTYTIDKKEKALLKADNFTGFMANESNGFKSLCDQLNEQIGNLPSYGLEEFVERAGTVTKQINSNQNIDFRIFDLTFTQATTAILKWENEVIDNSKYNEIWVDGTQANWDENIVPVINYRDQILKEFDNLFNLTTPSVRKENRERIAEKFNIVINNAQIKSVELSNKAVEDIVNKIIITTLHTVTFDPSQTFPTWSANVLIPILNSMYAHIQKTGYLNKIKTIWEGKIKAMFEDMSQKFKETHNQIKTKLAEYVESKCNEIKSFLVREQTDLLSTAAKDITVSFPDAVEKITNKLNTQVISQLAFKTEKIKWNLLKNVSIDEVTFADASALDNIIVKSQARSKKLSQLNNYAEGDGINTMGVVVSAYLLDVFVEKFDGIRTSILADELVAKQADYHSTQYSLSDWVKFKQFHQHHRALYDAIKAGDNDVGYINLFDTINNYMELSPNFITATIKPRCLVRYMYLVNTTNLFNIYETEEFANGKFKKIIPIYKQMESYSSPNSTDTTLVKFEFVCEIVNLLFAQAVGV